MIDGLPSRLDPICVSLSGITYKPVDLSAIALYSADSDDEAADGWQDAY